MTTAIFSPDRRIGASLVVLSFLLSSCGRVTVVRQEEVEERIKREIPVGSHSEPVIAFLDALNINGIKAEHLGYISGNAIGTDELKGSPSEVGGHIVGWIKRTATDHSKLQVYGIRMTFYFDKAERLIDHKIDTSGDW